MFGRKNDISRNLAKDRVMKSPFVGDPLPPTWTVLDKYSLNAPFAYAVVAEDSATGVRKYFLDELPLTKAEATIYSNLLDTLESELTVPRTEVDPKAYFQEQANRIITKYGIKASQISWPKIYYFTERDLVGFDVIDGLMKDPQIEDISADGVDRPIFVYQRKFESLETNIRIKDEERLNNLIAKLAHLAGKHVSTAFPIVQGTLPGRHRLAATFRREVSPYGGTLTIRKFREDPITIIDMLNSSAIDYNLASYVWLLMENGATSIVAGSTGAGKTTLLNALLTLTRTSIKIVTIEEVQEINIPHSNWTALVSRESFASAEEHGREVSLFDLVKTAMRMRPDILVVGEVRGEEAYVLFQAIASVTGDTPVLVREAESTKLMPIGELVDRFYPGDSERVAVPVSGIDVLSFDRAGDVSFRPVSYVLRHKADEVFRLRYVGGETRATGSHSVFVMDDEGGIVEKPVSELSTKDLLVSFAGSEVARKRPELDVESVLRVSDGQRLVTEKLLPACPSCESKRTWKRGHDGGRQRYQCGGCGRRFKDGGSLTFGNALEGPDGTTLLSFTRSAAVPKTLKVDAEFARVLGIYMAGGCVHSGSSIVFSLGTEEKGLFADSVMGFFSRLGAEPSVEDRGTYVLISVNHTPLARLFEALCGRSLKEKRIPSIIWTAPPDIVDAFLDGWRADAERTVDRSFIPYTSAKPELVNGLSWLSRMNGRTSFISERRSKHRSVWVSKPSVRPRNDCIPSALLRRLKTQLDSTAWYFCPSPRTRTISKARARKALQEIVAKKGSPVTWESARLISRILSLLNGSLIAVPVLKVEKEPYDGFVYDLSVPGTEAFFGGESPVALHNTGHGGLGTVHADDASSAIQRLTSKPMDVPPAFIPFLDLVFTIRRVAISSPGGGQRVVRRVLSVDEVVSVGNYVKMFSWDPQTDRHIGSPLRNSVKLSRLAKDLGKTVADLAEEINRRSVILRWAQQKGMRNFKELSGLFEEYRSKQKDVFEAAQKDMGGLRAGSEAQLEEGVDR
ncbi:MAG: Flp pilus assembly complex ATPase component TadA [Nitrososphaerota archaeon]|nr:Flp pilus assembly complex ATPase component TadA [Nitrososphaerota archaeon]